MPATNQTIKIAVDVSPLYDGNAVRGVGYYTRNLVDSLKAVVSTQKEYQNWSIDLITSPTGLISHNYRLIHYPYFNPFQLTLPAHKTVPFIVTVHDLIPLQMKRFFPRGLRGSLKWLLQVNRLKNADFIITPSYYSKHAITDFTHYPQNRIYVTHLASSSDFRPIKDAKKLNHVKAKYNLPDRFVLYVGDINRNKNVPSLVEACRELEFPLVIAGSGATKKDVPVHPETADILWLQDYHRRLSKGDQSLILTGFIPNDDIPYLFNLATVYCQPSYLEGFGLPLLEAMQSGTPVAYSRESSLSEVAGQNGITFDPYSVDSIKQALHQIWTNSKLHKELSQKGLKRAREFSWAETALQTLSVYKLALKNG